MQRFRLPTSATAAALSLALACAACGSTEPGLTATGGVSIDSTTDTTSADTSSDDSTATSSPSPVTTTPESTDVDTTLAPTTTAEATTTTVAPTVPTVPTVPSGWVPAEFGLETYAPRDESNWVGVPSPALPTDPSGTLADGIYEASPPDPWSAAQGATLPISVRRLELCTNLPADSCVDYGEPFGPLETNIDVSSSFQLVVPLDNTLRVGVTGSDCEGVVKAANGADLLELFGAFNASYAGVIQPLIDAGTEPFDIAPIVAANPAQGFTGHSPECTYDYVYELVYHYGDAPPLLLQQFVAYEYDADGNTVGQRPLAPTDVMVLDTITVSGGRYTLNFYAAFVS